MSRPVVPLSDRIARATGVDSEYILHIIENYSPETIGDDCWPWDGLLVHLSPVMKLQGRLQTVRRVLDEACTGEPTPANTRLKPGCGNTLCVHPQHTLHVRPSWDQPGGEVPADTMDEIIDAVYSRDPPYNAASLAEEFDYPLERVQEAIGMIERFEV